MTDNVPPNPSATTDLPGNLALSREPARTSPKPPAPSAPRPPAPLDIEKALLGYRPTRSWEFEPMSPGQWGYLRGLDASETTAQTKGQASHLIKAILQGPPTYDQWHQLTRRGLWRDGMTRQQAMALCIQTFPGMPGW